MVAMRHREGLSVQQDARAERHAKRSSTKKALQNAQPNGGANA